MPNIPLVQSKRSIVGGLPGFDAPTSTPNAFGAQIGAAVQQLGGTIEDAAGTGMRYVKQQEDKERQSSIANANAQTDLVTPALQAQKDAPADGSGVTTKTYEAQTKLIEDNADKWFKNDAEGRRQYVEGQRARIGSFRDNSVKFEFGAKEANAQQQANTSIGAVINKVRMDSNSYDQAAADIDKVIDTQPNITAAMKPAMKEKMRSDLAGARFDSLVTNAKTSEEYDKALNDLKDEKWQKQMSPEQFSRTQNQVDSARKAFVTQQDAVARARLDSIEARSSGNQSIPDEEMQEMATLAKSAKSPTVSLRFQKVYDQQSTLREVSRLPASQVTARAENMRSDANRNSDSTNRAIGDAVAVGGGKVSASYLQRMVGRESGGRADAQNPDSTATGIAQFTEGTWLDTVRKFGGEMGVNPNGDRESVLAMRNNPQVALKGAAILARENAKYMKAQIGIDASDTELYLMHFLGKGGGVSFLQAMRSDPDRTAEPYKDFSAGQISANKSVFFKKDGTAKTYREVYENMAHSMSPTTTSVQWDRIQYLQQIAKVKETAQNNDPMSASYRDGVNVQGPLDQASDWARRGQQAMTAANYYTVPTQDMKPFTENEAAQLTKKLKEGSSDDQLALMAKISAMDQNAPGMARAALAQLGQKDTTLGYAAHLASEQGDTVTAGQIVRGNKRLEDDKSLAPMLGDKGQADGEFNKIVGPSLYGLAPEVRASILASAKAHYIETVGAKGLQNFDTGKFEGSVKAVMGAQSPSAQGVSPIGKINGETVVMPPGVDASKFDSAMDKMTVTDWTTMSADGNPPRHVTGEIVTPQEIAYEGVPEAVGGNMYRLKLADGTYASTGENQPNGRVKAYLFTPDPKVIDQADKRPGRSWLGTNNTPLPSLGTPTP